MPYRIQSGSLTFFAPNIVNLKNFVQKYTKYSIYWIFFSYFRKVISIIDDYE